MLERNLYIHNKYQQHQQHQQQQQGGDNNGGGSNNSSSSSGGSSKGRGSRSSRSSSDDSSSTCSSSGGSGRGAEGLLCSPSPPFFHAFLPFFSNIYKYIIMYITYLNKKKPWVSKVLQLLFNNYKVSHNHPQILWEPL